ncbi:heparinase II/III-like protein [Kribbella amoyensis]|uniref:Heparinase II/III-like protein n=1 Tax=Kribbella amoyensis TaxID=996641 RepID=A0A561BKC6_9ACTN|nr:heparinase II/III family protein [Kribbella amoyensis]TWD79273.1 heparinase II/III-like protein [Kribbella amoyensis]
MTTTTSPEKPRHIDARITLIGTDDLVKAFGTPAGVDDLASLRAFVAGRMRRPAWPLREWADAIRSTPAADAVIEAAAPLLTGVDVTGRDKGRSALYGFHYLGWLAPGVHAWLLTGDDRYLDAFGRHLDDWVEQRDSVVGEWPGLDPIWYSLGTWARCRSLLPTLEVLTESALPGRVWGRLVATLVGGARWAYDEHDVFRHGNWQLVCATELLHLSLVLPDLAESESWATRAVQRIDEHLLLDVYGDGGHYERSPGYHRMCLTALQTAAVIDHRYAEHPKLTAMHEWMAELASSGGWIPHLQDSGLEWPAASLLRGSYVLDNPALARTAAQWLTPEAFAVEAATFPAWEDADRQQRWLNTVATAPAHPVPQLPRNTVLADSGYAILRGHEVRAVINYGPHIEHELESHSHRAVLDLVLDGWEQPLLWEAGGPPSYDDPGYLTWYQSGRGHNTVLVDDLELGTDRDVRIDPLVDTGPVAVFSGRHSGSVVPQARTVAMVREQPAFVVVTDSAASDGHVFRACWQSLHPWRQVGPLAYDASAPNGPGLLLIEAAGPVEGTGIDSVEGVARRPVKGGTAEYGPLHSLVLTRDRGDFTTVLLPHAGADPADVQVVRDEAGITVDHGRTVDRIGASSWVRTVDGKLSWATGWRVRELVHAGEVLFRSTAEVEVVVDGGLTFAVTCSGRCGVWVPAAGERWLLNGVPVDAESEDGWAHLTLPYAGRWEIEGARHG